MPADQSHRVAQRPCAGARAEPRGRQRCCPPPPLLQTTWFDRAPHARRPANAPSPALSDSTSSPAHTFQPQPPTASRLPPGRRLSLWKWFASYFPVKLVDRTGGLDASKTYLLAAHPHGICAFSHFVCFCTDAAGVDQALPGITVHGTILHVSAPPARPSANTKKAAAPTTHAAAWGPVEAPRTRQRWSCLFLILRLRPGSCSGCCDTVGGLLGLSLACRRTSAPPSTASCACCTE